MRKTILVTGASGFLGSAVCRRLSAHGHAVIRTDRRGDVDIIGDLADAEFVAKLPRVEALVHAAAVQYLSLDLPLWSRRRYFERNNVTAARNLCNRYAADPVHVVNVGTSMMYRVCDTASYSTNDPMKGQGVYSESKLSAHRLLESSFPEWTTILPCIIGGPGREGLFKYFVRSIRRFGVAIVPGSGNSPIHLVHVDDVASLVCLVVSERHFGFFNAGAPDPLSIFEWIDEIADELGVRKIRRLKVPLLPVHAASALSGYRLLAREQLIMLRQPHVLDVSRSLGAGWSPERSNAHIAREIARSIAERDA